MRNIIFRGKSKITGEWLYGSLINNMFYSTDSNLCYIVDCNKLDYDCWADITEQLDDLEVINGTIGQYTEQNDIDGNEIYEGMIVNQKSVLVGDNENIDFTGYVRLLEGCWLIDNGKNVIPLWSEHRENKIIE